MGTTGWARSWGSASWTNLERLLPGVLRGVFLASVVDSILFIATSLGL